ncbi:EFR1 family ferrodoxin [Clostridium sp. CCUG 7971]|uniref:EFR1 family ferrodoxin n=1 Tax=Clostridium sp. CCUG 7971 TaxID=2811414 RepID=UPI001ABB34AE|nr:EFR1 family ferrodoxin [Clostridium sp. CCUG 7971]MBO3443886.1 EFR1 family ferrodoxin [Clostridium sp. CCUG 7971]
MIMYFSGTGNSAYVAKRIEKEIEGESLNLFGKIRNCDYSYLTSDKPWVIVAPTYAWRIPRIVHEWLMKTKLCGNRDIYFVMTCGGSKGDADKYLKKLCVSKGMNYKGCKSIIMPENYIALFKSPDENEALAIIEQSEQIISDTAQYIRNNLAFPEHHVTFKDKFNSGLVNDIFYPLFVHSKKFYITDACISCGKCEKVCPLGNIQLENGKPIWGNNCTHCMACICRCPKEAIEYGKNSMGMIRYVCPK